jgi:hypothetical protein
MHDNGYDVRLDEHSANIFVDDSRVCIDIDVTYYARAHSDANNANEFAFEFDDDNNENDNGAFDDAIDDKIVP